MTLQIVKDIQNEKPKKQISKHFTLSTLMTIQLTWACFPRLRCRRRRASSPSSLCQRWHSAWRHLNPTSGRDRHIRSAGFETRLAWTQEWHLRGNNWNTNKWNTPYESIYGGKQGMFRASVTPLGMLMQMISVVNEQTGKAVFTAVTLWARRLWKVNCLKNCV